ncbi:hypothetical protein STCU_11904 [Strigomonas culicis]|uniref:Uncharacterized protein n=1 Tax=Strigomonas culicis TaxID=28005 RepID=S9TFB8_9TRYP|nr:hypothetical protein STCU_11904 [Strigomonas culicis]|eukprot:EPY15594.1 hypothetical protein STCU_11904 [Strigomonas culicis]
MKLNGGAAAVARPSSARPASRKGSTTALLPNAKEKEVRRGSLRSNGTSAHPMHLLDAQGTPSLSQQRAMVGTTLPQRPSVTANAYAPISSARSHSPSMRSGTNTRSRPQISYNVKDDTTTMKGTSTTVVFRSRSPQETHAPLLPEETRRVLQRGDNFVSERFSTTTYQPNRTVDVNREGW